ncbi:cell division protein FtsW [Candidatus Magnetoovum chiemensis]|nr:cell division protein FtsW [Candidatus Magnetoovum chiemensis]
MYKNYSTRNIMPGSSDILLMINTILLVLIGIFMVYSSSSVVAPGGADTAALNDLRYLKKHLMSVVVGFTAMFICMKIKLEALRRNAHILLIVAFLGLLLVFLPGLGISVNGARRWIRFVGFTFQPSELLKFSMVIFLARYLSSEYFNPNSFKAFIIPIAMMGTMQATLILQPDFGSAFTIGILTFSLLFIAKVRLRYIFGLGIFLIPVVIKLIMEPYRLKRVLSFLDPWASERDDGFQLIQSFVALGNGGVSGVGIGQSTQKLFFLPESKTDFIFSIIGEEAGFIGAGVVVALFLLFFLKGFSMIKKIRDEFYYYLAFGIVMMIVFQAMLNMAVVTGLLPTKGLPLPFISYGGTSMMINLAATGLLLNISKGDGFGDASLINRDFIKRKNIKKNRIFKYEE